MASATKLATMNGAELQEHLSMETGEEASLLRHSGKCPALSLRAMRASDPSPSSAGKRLKLIRRCIRIGFVGNSGIRADRTRKLLEPW